MNHRLLFALLAIAFAISMIVVGCKKDDETTTPSDGATYPVSATVLNPQGQPQGGAILTLKNPPSANPIYSAYTNVSGQATIQSPAGAQILVAKIGSAFLTEIPVNVAASPTGTNAGTITLVQNAAIKVLVVKASAEQLEAVLHVIGFNTFDSTTIYALIDSANVDSTRFLTWLRQYTLVFSDCDGGSEGNSSYALLSRTYGRYVAAGGKMYGGHYNYYHLQRIWPTFYDNFDTQGSTSTDTLQIVDQQFAGFVGFTLADWDSSSDSRHLSGYEKFSDLPTGSKTYAVIYRTSPSVGVIVENYIGTGKYVWTDYHNQDIKNVSSLVKLVQYFLLNM